jgi:serine/threonine protein kinase
MNFCTSGTPLYSSPQLLSKRSYSYKHDVWAIGITCYQLLHGRTPFHSQEMKDLQLKVNVGQYTIQLREALSLEAALFICQCLQAQESDRLGS